MDFLQQIAPFICIGLIPARQPHQRGPILRRGLLIKVVLASHI